MIVTEEVKSIIRNCYPCFTGVCKHKNLDQLVGWVCIKLTYCAKWKIFCWYIVLCEYIKKRWLSEMKDVTYHTCAWMFLNSASHAGLQIVYHKTHPTFGMPTIPHFREVPNLPRKSGDFSSSFFLGGIPFIIDLRWRGSYTLASCCLNVCFDL